MATTPLQQDPIHRVSPTGEIRGRALVAHVEAQLALDEAANQVQKASSSSD
jgi:hypothetical protein